MARTQSWNLRTFWAAWMRRLHLRRGPVPTRPRFEALEDRTVPASFSPLPGTLDGTAGSLRAVINTSNTNVDASNTINLSAGTYNLVALGDLQLTAAKTYTFVGKGPGSTFINAQQFERAFEITTTATVVFQNLTILNGLATDNGSVGAPFDTDALGGGILNNGGAITLNNAVVRNCVARGSAGANGTAANLNGGTGQTAGGGGIFSVGGSLTLINGSVLAGDQADGGNGGNGITGNGQFSGGGNGGDAFGGGLAASGTVVSLTGGGISSNVARAGNGGNGANGDNRGESSAMGGNGGNGGNAQGGGLFISDGSLTINGNNDPSNQAIAGNAGNAGNGVGSDVRGGDGGNGGNAQGGGLYVSGVGTASLTLLSVNPGSALGGNGGVGGHGGSESDSGGSGGNGGNGGNGQGGGIYTTDSTLTLTTSTINAGRAAGGNGINGGDAGSPSDTRANTDTGWNGGTGGSGGLGQGGGLFVDTGTVTVFRSTVSASTSTGGNGAQGGAGGHINDGNSDLAAGVGGAGGAGGNAQGGGLYAGDAALTVSDSTLANNVVGAANTGVGGAGGTGGRGTNHNAADGSNNNVNGGTGGTGGNGGNGGNSQGGALYNATATVQLRNSTIASNRANAGGAGGTGGPGGAGGTGATGKIGGAGGTGGTGGNLNTNGTTGKAGHAHSGTNGGAGGLGGTGGAGVGGQGGGVDNVDGDVSVVSTIIAKDVLAAGFGTTAKGPDVLGSFTTLGNNLIGNSANGSGFTFHQIADLVGGNGHPIIDPLLGALAFNGGPTQTMALLKGSPAIDGGSNPDALTVDQRGLGRVDNLLVLPPGTPPDIGAYETPIFPPLPPPPSLVFPSKRFFLASNF